MRHLPRRNGGHDGFIVVAVLWILMALATLATVYSVYVANSAIAQSVTEDRIQADALITAGLELTAYRLSLPAGAPGQPGQAGQRPPAPQSTQPAQAAQPGQPAKTAQRPTRGAFNFRLGRGAVTVSYLTESARIDLNAAPKEMLANLFAVLGAEPRDADQYADRIIGWRTRLKPEQQPAEDAIYSAAGLRYAPRGAPFAHVNELWLVAGLSPAWIARAMPFVTIYSGRADVDVIDAAPEVIAALPGMSAARVNAFLSQRESLPPDPQIIAAALGTQAGAGAAGGDTYRVRIRVTLDKGVRSEIEAVILLGGGEGPYGVLSWQDETE